MESAVSKINVRRKFWITHVDVFTINEVMKCSLWPQPTYVRTEIWNNRIMLHNLWQQSVTTTSDNKVSQQPLTTKCHNNLQQQNVSRQNNQQRTATKAETKDMIISGRSSAFVVQHRKREGWKKRRKTDHHQLTFWNLVQLHQSNR